TLHGVTPLMAGYIVALESVCWGIAAVIVSGRSGASDTRLIRTGTILITAGILGFALAMPNGPMWALILSAVAQGAGFGISWAFVVARITKSAALDQKDVASSSIPTIQQIGFAFGAAAAGIVANTAGFSDEVTASTARSAASWIFAGFLPFALVANFAAWRLTSVRHSRQGT
ncbi:MAG: MFS transporter, partial [Hyphomicrobiaceae bacterium]